MATDKDFEKKERGVALVEYALLIALLAVVCLGAIRTLGTRISTQLSETAGQL